MTTSTFFITDDTHSLCNVKERFAELEAERDAIMGGKTALNELDHPEQCAVLDAWDNEHGEEFAQLQSILDQVDASTLDNDEMLINEAYFTEYCAELCEEIGAVPKGTPDYITRNIDWEGVARELMQDYSEIEVDGVTFYYRPC